MSLLPQINNQIDSDFVETTEIPSKTYKIINDSVKTFTEFKDPTTVENNDIITIDNLGYNIINIDKIKGNSRQTTRDGSNLYNVYDKSAGETYGIKEEDWLEVITDNSEGTSTKYYNIFTKASSQVKTSTTYYLVVEIKNVSGSGRIVFTSSLQGSQFKNTTDVYFSAIKSGDIIIKEINTLDTFESSTMFLRSFVQATAGQSGSVTFRMSVLEQQPDLDTFVYQPYGVMPSPNYPSNIETVGGNINEFDKESISENKAINGYYSNPSYGQLVNSSLSNTTDYMPIQKGKSYIFHFDYDTLGSSNNRAYCFYNEQKEVISSVKDTLYNLSNKELKFTATQNGFVRITYDKNCKDIKFELGTKSTSYSPYGQGSVEIDVSNKNRLDFKKEDWIATYFNNDGTENDYYPLSETLTDRKYYNCRNISKMTLSFLILQNCQISRGQIVYYDKNKEYINMVTPFYDKNYTKNQKVTYLMNIPENACYFRINFRLILKPDEDGSYTTKTPINMYDEFYNYISELMIEDCSNATSYIEHQSQTKIVPIQEEMLEDDYIDDVEYHTWGKKILTGNEADWNNAYGTNLFNIQNFLPDINTNIYLALCNYYKYNPIQSGINTGTVTGEFAIQNTAQRKGNIFIKDKRFSTVEQWKAWLQEKYNSGNPVIVYYKLATPKSLPLTEEQKEVMSELNNIVVKDVPINIYVNDGDLPIISIKYYTKDNIIYKTVETDRIIGFTDGIDAIKQAIYHILATERYAYLIYDNNYGVELEQYIGKDLEYIEATIEQTLKEALTHDLRITDVSVTNINKVSNDTIKIDMIVISIYGNIEMEVNVNV